MSNGRLVCACGHRASTHGHYRLDCAAPECGCTHLADPMPEQAQFSACRCDAFGLTAERHRAICPVGHSWARRNELP